ncbi:uncharacterized protein E0L32_007950 [Thyridium curvatum]|uniref:Dynein light intermediate chain n=1 Tax=Thyridium curvatum TaxID=1093900 RepID=A0A507B1D9_9PEZI|nr:uncharacterized protein E0L32_007950 [Thyridium curvatum]TPX11089.1 hypothetical protein E0L32_007950 [Thyridium curvatum]
MATNTNRFSTYTAASGGSESKDGEKKKDMWSSMLDSVASGKRLPEKNLLVLGGTVESQRDFLEALSTSESRQSLDRQNSKIPPFANSFALGYTYHDVLDADQEDILARISLYLLTTPSPSFSSLIQPLLTPQSIPNTLIVILLDWSHPWRWMRQLQEWILLLRTVLVGLSNECTEAMEEVMVGWRDRGRGGGTNLDGTSAVTGGEGDVALPLGPGEWEDALGLPLCVVCQNAQKMEVLEKTHGWKEEEFDVVLQYMRTVLLRHGASLVYTTPNLPSQLQSLIHSSLGITSLLKRQPLKHNVIDRDKIVVPPNWDSWGKIRVLREGFEVEGISNAWSVDLNQDFPLPETNGEPADESELASSAVLQYEQSIQDPSVDALVLAGQNSHTTKLEVETADTQAFLGEQLTYLEALRKKMEEAARAAEGDMSKGGGTPTRGGAGPMGESDGGLADPASRVNDHIGPVQFNMGGIQVDADDMLNRLKNRQAYGSSPEPDDVEAEQAAEEAKPRGTEHLEAFFSGLMNRKGAKAG